MKSNGINSAVPQSPIIRKKKPAAENKGINTRDSFNFTSSSEGKSFDIKDAAKTLFGKSGESEKAEAVEEMWSYDAGNSISARPLYLEGKLYAGNQSRELICLNAKTGNKEWTVSLKELPTEEPVAGPDNTVISSTCQGHITCHDTNTGKEVWSYKTAEDVGIDLVMGDNNVLYGGSIDNKMYAIDAKTGKKKWEYDSGGWVLTKAAVLPDNSLVFGNADGKVISIDGRTGKEIWNVNPDNGAIQSDPVVGNDNTVYAGGNHGRLIAFDGKTGKEKWSFDTGGQAGSPTLYPGGNIIFVSGGKFFTSLHAVSTKTGKALWKCSENDITGDKPVVLADGSICLKTKNKLIGLNPLNGEKLWEKSPGYNPKVPVLGKGGEFFTGARNGMLYGYKLKDYKDPDETEDNGKTAPEKNLSIVDEEQFVVIGGVKVAKNVKQ